MPPYWALGFHLCRWGYGSANNTWDVVRRMREHLIPHVRTYVCMYVSVWSRSHISLFMNVFTNSLNILGTICDYTIYILLLSAMLFA